MGRLFAGTAWDRPPTCERCGELETVCSCPPEVATPTFLPPSAQTPRLRVERRAKGKVVTVVANLNPTGTDFAGLSAVLKEQCGAGGTVKDGRIELQGDQVASAEGVLLNLGYPVKRG